MIQPSALIPLVVQHPFFMRATSLNVGLSSDCPAYSPSFLLPLLHCSNLRQLEIHAAVADGANHDGRGLITEQERMVTVPHSNSITPSASASTASQSSSVAMVVASSLPQAPTLTELTVRTRWTGERETNLFSAIIPLLNGGISTNNSNSSVNHFPVITRQLKRLTLGREVSASELARLCSECRLAQLQHLNVEIKLPPNQDAEVLDHIVTALIHLPRLVSIFIYSYAWQGSHETIVPLLLARKRNPSALQYLREPSIVIRLPSSISKAGIDASAYTDVVLPSMTTMTMRLLHPSSNLSAALFSHWFPALTELDVELARTDGNDINTDEDWDMDDGARPIYVLNWICNNKKGRLVYSI